MSPKYKTALIGFGLIGVGLSDDPQMAKYFKYSTHAQVLVDHPDFSWLAVVDPRPEARNIALEKWNVPYVFPDIDSLNRHIPDIDVVIVATPPRNRFEIISKLSHVKAVFVEKPLGETLEESRRIVQFCKDSSILLQVNYWRRGDQLFQNLAGETLHEYVGRPLTAFGLYGRGLKNNGAHVIDFIRMLLGDIKRAQLVSPELSFAESPIESDINLHAVLLMESGISIAVSPIPFRHYRENSLDIWGDNGRVGIFQEGLGIFHYPKRPNRGLQNEFEIASDQPHRMDQTCGTALYRMYDNLTDALRAGIPLWSSGNSALRTEEIISSLYRSHIESSIH